MEAKVNDRWTAAFEVEQIGEWQFAVEAWVDQFRSWRRDMVKRIDADQDLPIDYLTGAAIVREIASRGSKDDRDILLRSAEALEQDLPQPERRRTALDEVLAAVMLRNSNRSWATRSEAYRLLVDPVRARFSAWYEFFPRSTSPEPGRHGTFRDSERFVEYAARMGFDVVYLPPIHPIGESFRKGRNNAVTAEPDDTGSPWAVGSRLGGHKSIHPELGTVEDFQRLVAKARSLGLELALDVAFQAAPDHPYVKENSAWFRKRPDGSIQYAENPPKKYQDIYPFDFESEDWEGMWDELKSVFLFWIQQGVTIFRVDNPHTKAFPFWEWCINGIKREHPNVLFLSEAFTRPKVMYRLAKLGFSQSYTYFPWRHTKWELTNYFTELTKPPVSDFFRGNHWPNTPDILTDFLQTTGRPGFTQRLLLCSTLSANYGIYGPAFEHFVSEPRHHGSEEYKDSEKYQLRHWDLERDDSLRDLITLVNRIRRENPALQTDDTLQFHPTDNDQMICYSKQSSDGANLLVIVINLDPVHRHAGYIHLPLGEMGIEQTRPYQVHELLTGARYIWHGDRNYVELDPHSIPGHIFRVHRRIRTEREFEYFL
jgi:starch synthase (maltosyl-transferring)